MRAIRPWTHPAFGPAGPRPERGRQVSLRTADLSTGVDPGNPIRPRSSAAGPLSGAAIVGGRLRTAPRRGAHDSAIFRQPFDLAVACLSHRRQRHTRAPGGESVVPASWRNRHSLSGPTLRPRNSERRRNAFYSRSHTSPSSSPGGAGTLG